MRKKAQGLSLNTIIIAAIVIIVLIVLVLIFTGRMAIFTGSIKSCAHEGGQCADTCTPGVEYYIPGTDCDEKGERCCVPSQEVTGRRCEELIGGSCQADGGANLVSRGREDCPLGSECFVESNCGGTCVEGNSCPAGDTRVWTEPCGRGYVCCVT